MINVSARNKKDVLIIYSIIIPFHDGAKYLRRLLDSILIQKNSPTFEVIIQDDNSTESPEEIINEYLDKLNIKYFKSNREIHCPGNTRIDGMNNSKGKWITFIDQDDVFEEGAFEEVAKAIINNREANLVVGSFREYREDNDTFSDPYENTTVWLHGKWYNRDFLNKYDIKFKENLTSNEDLYFNQQVFSTIVTDDLNYTILKVNVYRWMFNEDSVGRSMFKKDRFYIDTYYKDYIYAASAPWIDKYWNNNNDGMFDENILIRLCWVAVYAYFYYQSLLYRNKSHVRENRDVFEDYINNIKKMFDIDNKIIADIVYGDANTYNIVRKDALNGCMEFVENESFREFINRF